MLTLSYIGPTYENVIKSLALHTLKYIFCLAQKLFDEFFSNTRL